MLNCLWKRKLNGQEFHQYQQLPPA